MNNGRLDLDCVIVGLNEVPFPEYERFVRGFGSGSCAHRELKLSFVEVDGRPLTYLDLLNRAEIRARERRGILDGFREYRSGDVPNLAAVYLTNYLGRRGFSAEYVNLFQEEKARLELLLARRPICAAITTTFYVTNYPAKQIVELIRRRDPQIPIVVGGPLIANHARRFTGAALDVVLEELGADVYVVESQGELTLARIVSVLKSNGSLESVPNLVFRSGKGYRRTAAVPENNSLDGDYVDWKNALACAAGSGSNRPATIHTRTARGCAFRCAFCGYPTRAGRLHLADLTTVEKELDSLRDFGGVSDLAFVDDSFNVPAERFRKLCLMLIKGGYGFRWYSYLRCDHVDEETVELMARSGCVAVFLGIESGSQSMLDRMAKTATPEQYRFGVRLLKEHGILTFGSFLLGFPGETAETVKETVSFIRSLQLDFYRIQPWYCEAGTPVEEKREEVGLTGSGFNWRHSSMSAMEAMSHVERAFCEIEESCWLPQWAFDFWIIPYLVGRGIPLDGFRRFMASAQKLLKLEFSSGQPPEKQRAQDLLLERMVDTAQTWCCVK